MKSSIKFNNMKAFSFSVKRLPEYLKKIPQLDQWSTLLNMTKKQFQEVSFCQTMFPYETLRQDIELNINIELDRVYIRVYDKTWDLAYSLVEKKGVFSQNRVCKITFAGHNKPTGNVAVTSLHCGTSKTKSIEEKIILIQCFIICFY